MPVCLSHAPSEARVCVAASYHNMLGVTGQTACLFHSWAHRSREACVPGTCLENYSSGATSGPGLDSSNESLDSGEAFDETF